MAVPGSTMIIVVGSAQLCATRVSCTETLTTADATTTCSSVDANGAVYEAVIGTARKMIANIEGQFGSNGGGNPPYADLGEVINCTLGIGHTFVGPMMITQWDFAGEIKGILTFTLQLTSIDLYTVA